MQQLLAQTQQLFELPTLIGRFAIREIEIKEGTISPQTTLKKARFEDVLVLKVHGEHHVEFPREGIKIAQPAVQSYSVEKLLEKCPQILEVRGRVRPTYTAQNLRVVPLEETEIYSQSTTLDVLDPTSFWIWARYISPEERLLHATKQELVGPSKIELRALLSPSVVLTYADGRVDADSGSQVVEYLGRIRPQSKIYNGQPKLELQHAGKHKTPSVLKEFTATGTFGIRGYGRLTVPYDGLSSDGGTFQGTAHYDNGFVRLLA